MTLAKKRTARMTASAETVRRFMLTHGIHAVIQGAPANWTVDQAMDFIRESRPDWIIFEEGTK